MGDRCSTLVTLEANNYIYMKAFIKMDSTIKKGKKK